MMSRLLPLCLLLITLLAVGIPAPPLAAQRGAARDARLVVRAENPLQMDHLKT